MKINVTEEHLKLGKRNISNACPIALAFISLGKKYVSVDGVYCLWDGGIAVLPKKAQKFVNRFDQGQPVKPFTFTVEARLK